MLPFEAIPGLNGFVLYFALPCMLFRFGASTPIAQLLDAGAFFMYLFCALVMVAFVVAVTLSPRIGWNDAAFGALVGAFPNTGFMGVPLLVALLGAAAAGPAIVTIVIDMVITTSLCIALSRLDGAGQHGVGTAAKNALMGMAKNPMPWAILLGTLFSAFQVELPEPVAKTVGLLGDAASPVALFTIGALLARPVPAAAVGWWHWQRGGVDVLLVVLKLVVHPLWVAGLGWVLIQWGLPLTPTALMAVVLVAALPSASNTALLAERFGADSTRITRVILLSTALAFPSFSAWVAWYKT
jgi:predicted permease